MSTEIHQHFRKGMTHDKAERGKPQQDPPLHFVPSKASKGEDDNDSTLKMISTELDQNTTQKVSRYGCVCIKKILNMQKMEGYNSSARRA